MAKGTNESTDLPKRRVREGTRRKKAASRKKARRKR